MICHSCLGHLSPLIPLWDHLISSCKNSLPAYCLIENLLSHLLLLLSSHILPESTEGIPSVNKSLQQASSQASKLLHPLAYDYKRLEVSGMKEKTRLKLFRTAPDVSLYQQTAAFNLRPLWKINHSNAFHNTTFPQCVIVIVVDVQDFINQLIAMETVITQARSLRAKFASCKKDQDTAEVDEWVTLIPLILPLKGSCFILLLPTSQGKKKNQFL